MLFKQFRGNREKKKKLVHIISGVIILIHAWEKYETGHDSWIWFGIAGIVFLSVALLHHVIEKKAPWVDGVFFLIEAALSLIIAYEYFHHGKKALPFCYLFAGLVQMIMAIVMSKKGMIHHQAGNQTPGDSNPANPV